MDNGVLLHVRAEKEVHAELEELPQDADGHGEAEGHKREVEGREVEGDLLAVVEELYQGEAHRRGQESVEGMEHGVPAGDADIEGVDLAQNLRREDEAEHRDLKGRRQLDVQLHLDPAGGIEQSQGQGAVESALVAAQHELADQAHNDKGPENGEDEKGALMLPQLHPDGLLEGLLLPLPPLLPHLLFSAAHMAPPRWGDVGRKPSKIPRAPSRSAERSCSGLVRVQ